MTDSLIEYRLGGHDKDTAGSATAKVKVWGGWRVGGCSWREDFLTLGSGREAVSIDDEVSGILSVGNSMGRTQE